MNKQVTIAAVILTVFSLLYTSPTAAQEPDQAVIAHADSALVKLVEIQEQVKDIHPFLQTLQPVAVVVGEEMYIFEIDSTDGHYRFVKMSPTPFPMSPGIRASFPLAATGNRPACVVSSDVFDSMDGYVEMLHEFVHCGQFLTCEQKLKDRLEIAKEAAAKQDFMWELNHAFPYFDSTFIADYTQLQQALAKLDTAAVQRLRSDLKQHLSQQDIEYMVWQEWKEGMARLVENRIRARLGLAVNNYGSMLPYSRITFYYGGANEIAYLTARQPQLFTDLEGLFAKMME